jgi:predicted nucleic acid-binding protein
MDPTTEEHKRAKDAILGLQNWAINPTVVHETYHSLVFKRKILPNDAGIKIGTFVRDGRTKFLNITKTISLDSIRLAIESKLGGRDSLIIGCYLSNGIDEMLTHDGEVLLLKEAKLKGKTIRFIDPLR